MIIILVCFLTHSCHHNRLIWKLSWIHLLMPRFRLDLKFLHSEKEILNCDKLISMLLEDREQRGSTCCRGIKSIDWLGSRITASQIWGLRRKLRSLIFFWLHKKKSLLSAWEVLLSSSWGGTHTSVESLLSNQNWFLNFLFLVSL